MFNAGGMPHYMPQVDVGLAQMLVRKANILRLDVVRMVGKAGSGHVCTSLSAADIVAALYFRVMQVDPQNPKWPERDRFILAKGQASPILYAALAEKGYFPRENLDTLRDISSILQGHPDMTKTPGVDFSTGPVGEGLSVGAGMALAGKLDRKTYRVFVLLGDGELNEGQVWEAAMFASHYGLDNLIAIVDRNRFQVDGMTEEVMGIEPVVEKWRSFGWHVREIDGHNLWQILAVLEEAKGLTEKPTVIIAHTQRGKGVSFMEGVRHPKGYFYGELLSEKQIEQALRELEPKTGVQESGEARSRPAE